MSGYNPPLIFQKATDADGNPAPGAKLYHYVTESTILKDIFADFELTTPLPQPLVASADGSFQQYFMEPGYYKFVLLDQHNNQLLPPQDHVCGAGAGGTAPEDDHKVLVDETDTTPGYLYEKLEDTTGIFWEISGAVGGVHAVRGEVQPGAGDTYKVKGTSSDATPGFLADKIANSNTVDLAVVDNKLIASVTGPYTLKVDDGDSTPDYLYEKLEDTDGIHWEISGTEGSAHHVRGEVQPGAGDTYKVKQSASDAVPGYLGAKIAAGTGVVINTTTDNTNGTVMHISTTSQSTGKVKVTSTDTTADYLGNKLVAGPGMTITPVVSGATTLTLAPITTYIEDVIPFASAINIGNSTAIQNVCSVVLTAGSWEVEGSVNCYCRQSGSLGVQLRANIGTTGYNINYDGFDQWSDVRIDGVVGASQSLTIARRRYTVTGNTAVYLCAQEASGTFAGGLMWGNITARRIL